MVRDEKVDFGGGAFALLGVLKHPEVMAYRQGIEGIMYPGDAWCVWGGNSWSLSSILNIACVNGCKAKEIGGKIC